MTAARRTALRSAAFDKNVERRGKVPNSVAKKANKFPVGPWSLALFVFLVIGSAILQIISTTQKGGI